MALSNQQHLTSYILLLNNAANAGAANAGAPDKSQLLALCCSISLCALLLAVLAARYAMHDATHATATVASLLDV